MVTKGKEFEKIKKEICQILMRIGALKFGIFTLSSGKTSPYYIDLRVIPSFPDAFKKICDLYLNVIQRALGVKDFERISGIPTAGLPFASVIAYLMNKPFMYVRKTKRMHGRERRIEGLISPGDQILLIDDLITSGTSFMKAAKAVISEGGIIRDAVVLIDREENGKDNLRETNLQKLNWERITKNCYVSRTSVRKVIRAIHKDIKKEMSVVVFN